MQKSHLSRHLRPKEASWRAQNRKASPGCQLCAGVIQVVHKWLTAAEACATASLPKAGAAAIAGAAAEALPCCSSPAVASAKAVAAVVTSTPLFLTAVARACTCQVAQQVSSRPHQLAHEQACTQKHTRGLHTSLASTSSVLAAAFRRALQAHPLDTCKHVV